MKPRKQILPLADALKWAGGAVFQKKLDGRFAVRDLPGGTLAGEDVRGVFWAFDCLSFAGEDVRGDVLADRLRMRDELAREGVLLIVPETTSRGGEFLAAILANGGEGVVRKEFGSTYFDAMTAAKRLEAWICRVTTAPGAVRSVSICDAATGQDRGRVALLGNRCDLIRAGSLIKVEGFGLTSAGKIREPRPCKDAPDSWLVKF